MLPESKAGQKVVGLPRVGKSAPYFRAESDGLSFSIDDFEGGWLVLFSQPAHCTPADTEEFVKSIEIYPVLKRVGVAVLGLSVDVERSVMHRIIDLSGDGGVETPLVVQGDVSQEVSLAYGRTWLSGGMSGRSVYIIDDEQVVRVILYYHMPMAGRMREVLKILAGLRTTYDDVASSCIWNAQPHG